MTIRWYLVKKNWPQTEVKLAQFAGVGGDVWPLDAVDDPTAKKVHNDVLASRHHVQVGPHTELLCTDRSVAEEYWAETERHLKGAWLLEVAQAIDSERCTIGFDLGFPAGGFSLVESELVTQSLSGPLLNEWGLIRTIEEALAYLEGRGENEALEAADDIETLAVRVLRQANAYVLQTSKDL